MILMQYVTLSHACLKHALFCKVFPDFTGTVPASEGRGSNVGIIAGATIGGIASISVAVIFVSILLLLCFKLGYMQT